MREIWILRKLICVNKKKIMKKVQDLVMAMLPVALGVAGGMFLYDQIQKSMSK